LVEYWIGFGGLLEGTRDWTDGLFLVTRQRRAFSYVVRFTGELQRRWEITDRAGVVEVIKRYGYHAIKEELRQGRESDGTLIMLSSDTSLERDPAFLQRWPYELPPEDLVRFMVEVGEDEETSGWTENAQP
jgi:hypothetical protein